MPTFCRHNRLIQNCPICSREQAIEPRPLVTPSGPRPGRSRPEGPRPLRSRATATPRGPSSGMTIRRLARGDDDGFRSPLVPGVRSSADAERLAEELAFAATRLLALAQNPPGLYAEVADRTGDLEERTWLAFLIACIPPGDGEEPFAGVRVARTPWSSGEPPVLDGIETGLRGGGRRAPGARTFEAYRAWAGRAGSQAAAFTGDPGWSAERRFGRVYERLSLPGLERENRFELLTELGWLGVYDVRAGSLQLGGDNEVTVAAKRALGIGDPLLLERRAAQLAEACAVPLEALDLGFHNWELGRRTSLGLPQSADPDGAVLEATRSALGL